MPNPNQSIRVLVVDDEPLARERVVDFLHDQPGFEVVGSVGDGEAALKNLFECQPDLLLLDIEMPDQNAFDLLACIPKAQQPVCIFITAYPQHAVKAFEVAALDYVLKPFRRQRLAEALARAEAALRTRSAQQEQPVANQERDAPATLTIDFYGSRIQLPYDQIDWLVADGNYVKLNAQQRTYYKRVTLMQMLELLEDYGFVQVHRSIVVNRAAVRSSQYLGNNAYQIEMKDGQVFRTGRAFKQAVQKM